VILPILIVASIILAENASIIEDDEDSRRQTRLLYREAVQHPEGSSAWTQSKEYAKIICWDTDHRGIRILNQKKLE
jgi:hypothetical protein